LPTVDRHQCPKDFRQLGSGPGSPRVPRSLKWSTKNCQEKKNVITIYNMLLLCNWVLHLSNLQKVRLNTDLFSDMQKYLYTNQTISLTDNIKKGEGFNHGRAEVLAILIEWKVGEEVLRGRNCGRILSYKIFSDNAKIQISVYEMIIKHLWNNTKNVWTNDYVEYFFTCKIGPNVIIKVLLH